MSVEEIFVDCLVKINPSEFIHGLNECLKKVISYVESNPQTKSNREQSAKVFSIYLLSMIIMIEYEIKKLEMLEEDEKDNC